MAAKRATSYRQRTKHPGVTLKAPDGTHVRSWRASWLDPDTGKRRYVTLDLDHARTKETRQRWAKKKAREIRDRRLDLETGGGRAAGVPVLAAIERFYSAKPSLRHKTLVGYRAATGKLVQWTEQTGFRSTSDLTRGRLMAFRETIVNECKGTPEGKRGEYRKTGEPRSPYSINRELAAVRAVLRYASDCDLMPRASKDDVGRAFKLLSTPKPKRKFLKPKAAQKVLEAAQRFDAEHGEPHAAPFAAVLLLTGLRLGEARTLRWSQVDLEAVDAGGKAAGEVAITIDSKTHTARDVSLRVSPGARKILAALKLRSGGRGLVFGVEEETHWQRLLKALREHGAPQAFTWQALRATCGTYLVNAPGIPVDSWGAARDLGHSQQVAEQHYRGRFHGIDPEAKTLEAAMQIETQVKEIIASARQARKVSAA